MKKIIWLIICSLLLPILLCSCQSDGYYQEQAAQRARAYLLEEIPEMPLMDQEYIKFNRPFFLVSQLTGSYATGMAQICICWMTPDNPEVYMVYGASGMRMIDWTPQRIIRKQFKHPQENYLRIAGNAAEDLLQNQFDLLSVESVNRIRFTLPGVWKCKFPLNSNPGCELSPEALTQADALPRYVLAWQLRERGAVYYAVYGGTAKDDELNNFREFFRGLYSEAEFMANLTDTEPVIMPWGDGSDGQ